MSLECKYKLQFGLRICSIEVGKQAIHRQVALKSTTKFTSKKSILERHSFPLSIGVCSAFLSRELPETAVWPGRDSS